MPQTSSPTPAPPRAATGAEEPAEIKNPTPAAWKADLKKLIARVKTKTDQIIVLSPAPVGGVGKLQKEITKVLHELVREENIAAADITRLAATGASRSPGSGWPTRGTRPTWGTSRWPR